MAEAKRDLASLLGEFEQSCAELVALRTAAAANAPADDSDDEAMDDTDDAQVTMLVSPRLPELLSPLRPHVVHQARDWLRRNFTVEELDLIVG